MKKIYVLTLLFGFIAIMSICFFQSTSYAALTMDSVVDDSEAWINRGKAGKDAKNNIIETFADDKFQETTDTVYRFIYTIGIALSVIISSILGIKIILATPEEKADIKEKLIPYIIGCAVMFGAFSIWAFVMRIAGTV